MRELRSRFYLTRPQVNLGIDRYPATHHGWMTIDHSLTDSLQDALFSGGTREETRHNKLLYLEHQFLAQVHQCLAHLMTEGGERHVRRGLMRRLLMMQASRLHARARCLAQQGSMAEYVATELNTHLNSYYINLAGALDNLAWALSFELKLRDPLSENEWKSRRFCTMTRPEFSTFLDRARPGAAAVIGQLASWLSEVKEFRDPAAHRLPLTVVAAVLDATDVEAHGTHQAAASQALI